MGFNLTTVRKLSSKEKQRSHESNPGLLREKRERYLCAKTNLLVGILVSPSEI